jgi:hypothetical protein
MRYRSHLESVPNETMNPLFLFELIHTTVVPALMQNNWLFLALGIPGFTLEELPDRVTCRIFHALNALKMRNSTVLSVLRVEERNQGSSLPLARLQPCC